MIVALDLETTGLNEKEDKIIEIALIKFDEKTFEIVDKFTSLVNPEIHIPELNSNITNIYDSDVKDAPTWDDIIEEVTYFIGDNPILGHNIYFDRKFLIENDVNVENNIALDTFLLANCLVLGEKSLSLEYLCKFFSIKLENAHRAYEDTKSTIELFKKLITKLTKLPKVKKEITGFILSKTNDSGFGFILKNYIKIDFKTIGEEEFVKNISKIYPKKKKYTNKNIDNTIDNKKFIDFTSGIESLEIRSNQEKMANYIDNAFEEEKLLAIEAPTGIGKTFAYLLPSIFHSIKTGEQVFVSTSTKALQDQIYYKDLEFLKKNLGYDFSYSKLKGKSNYVGLNSLLNFIYEEELLSNVRTSFIIKILLWISVTKYGELDELDYYGQEFSFIYQINADDSLTFSSDNAYEDREFAVSARRQSRLTNIVIINNNILFQDIDGDNNILSKVENLVLDEAHNLEDVVTSSLQKNFCLNDLEKFFKNIEKIFKKYKQTFTTFNSKKEEILFEIAIVFDLFKLYIDRKVKGDTKYKNALIKQDFFDVEVDNLDNKSLLNSIKLLIIDFIDGLKILSDAVYLALSREIKTFEKVLDILSKTLDKKAQFKYICIASYNDRKGVILEYTYLNPGEYLENKLWNKLSTCILTSATLKTSGNFNYIKNILSLEKFDFKELETDFDYKKQALLFIPNDIGSIKNNFENVTYFLRELFLTVKGNLLVLFTSFYSIKETYIKLGQISKDNGITLYPQSIGGGKNKLIEFYKENSDNSILIGTSTFWEGIDIPGEQLKYLVIHKIPFMVPSDPIFQARSVLFEDSFSEYSIPKSIIKLKQGFGRLIRTKTDTGIVIFLDDRLYSTRWGEEFYSAFPSEIKKKIGSSKGFLDVLKQI